ncbi:MAG: quinone-dependent dihydroorotate dehydrogenase [Flavobacteriales bacterium]|nr:quinone-dependent dihydroorotate dehydrogenase [Flavobacteriales bacterium]
MYKSLLRKTLFQLSAEQAHNFSFGFLKFIFQLPFAKSLFYASFNVNHPSLEREVFGIKFKNPVGLAAGFDKNARLYNEFSFMGFGFVEIGTVTPKPQDGNAKPRLFRLHSDEGLINRMGFNNDGVKKVVGRLKGRYTSVIIGGNIGKNKVTPNENALDDYLVLLNELYDVVDYFTVNVSSPNTPGLRELQEKEPLTKLLKALKEEAAKKSFGKPILLKIAPDLTDSQLDDIVDIVMETQVDGIIATNTTIDRSGLLTPEKEVEKMGAGGLSGKPLSHRSTEVIRYIHEKSKGSIPIVGVGGIHSAKDALEKLDAGASLVQLYTGFVYEGPGLVKRINEKIIENARTS